MQQSDARSQVIGPACVHTVTCTALEFLAPLRRAVPTLGTVGGLVQAGVGSTDQDDEFPCAIERERENLTPPQ